MLKKIETLRNELYTVFFVNIFELKLNWLT